MTRLKLNRIPRSARKNLETAPRFGIDKLDFSDGAMADLSGTVQNW